jgi:fluoride ion exporter CrcB/FEX
MRKRQCGLVCALSHHFRCHHPIRAQSRFVVPMRPNTSLSPRQLLFAILAVAGGGGVGTLLRDLLVKLNDPRCPANGWCGYAPLQNSAPKFSDYIPWVLLAINFVGVIAVTRLLRGSLKGHDPNDPARLLIITGFFGGLTSYSGLFVDFDVLWHRSIAGCLLVAAMAILFFGAWLGLRRWSR